MDFGVSKALMKASDLGLPDFTKPFTLHVHKRLRIALGVLTQTLGEWERPVPCFSEQQDKVSKGWQACLWAVPATVLLIQEAWK